MQSSREKLMKDLAKSLLQTIYDTPDESRTEMILHLAKACGVEIVCKKEEINN